MHSIETELKNLSYANFLKDSVTEKNKRTCLEKAGEKTKQMLEKKRKQKWEKNMGITENSTIRTLKYSNHLEFVNMLERKAKTDKKHH